MSDRLPLHCARRLFHGLVQGLVQGLPRKRQRPWVPASVLACGLLGLSACSTPPTQPQAAIDLSGVPDLRVWVLSANHELLAVSLRDPVKPLERRPLQGLSPGDEIVGMDFRVARGELYALSRQGRLYRVDTATGQLLAIGSSPATALQGQRFEVDFNPTVDRLRVVSDSGMSLRLHPDTGQLVARDADLHSPQGEPVAIGATAYTYHPRDDKLTSNFVIDLLQARLMLQGSREEEVPVVSPNTGQLRPVGPLGLPAPLAQAALDISDRGNVAVAALRGRETGLYLLDLQTGRARPLGRLLDGSPILGLAIEP